MAKQYQSFQVFYPFYASQHQNRMCRILHLLGTTMVILSVCGAMYDIRILFCAPLLGYGLAWIGHFFFEKNVPATFSYPLYSLRSDFAMYWNILTDKESL